MKNFLIASIAILFFQFCHTAYSQKEVKKISKEACECIDKLNIETDSATFKQVGVNCITNALFHNTDNIAEIMSDKEKSNELIMGVMADLFKSCDKFFKLMAKEYMKSEVPPVDTVTNVECKKFHSGKFRHVPGSKDTTKYFIIEEKSSKQFNAEGELIEEYKIERINDCEYISTLVVSKDPMGSKLLSKGDKFKYKIVAVEGNTVTFQGIYRGMVFYNTLIKVE